MLSELKRVESADRSAYVGASEVGAILGLNPHMGAFEVWARKTGHTDPVADNAAMQRGRYLESGLLNWAGDKLGATKVESGIPLNEPGLAVPGCAFLSVRPDGALLVGGVWRSAECKTSRMAADWGDAGSDSLPDYYLAQVQAQLCAMPDDVTEAVVPVYLTVKDELRLMTVKRDREFGDFVKNEVGEWFLRHVLGDTPPALDASDAAKTYLTKKFGPALGALRAASRDEEATVQAWLVARDRLKAAEQDAERLANEVRALCGNAEGLTGSFGKVTWKWQKGSSRWDGDALLAHFGKDGAEAFKKQGDDLRVLRHAKGK